MIVEIHSSRIRHDPDRFLESLLTSNSGDRRMSTGDSASIIRGRDKFLLAVDVRWTGAGRAYLRVERSIDICSFWNEKPLPWAHQQDSPAKVALMVNRNPTYKMNKVSYLSMWRLEKARRAERQRGHVQKSCSGDRFLPWICTPERVITHLLASVGRCNCPTIDRGYLVIERKRRLSMFTRAINGGIISSTPGNTLLPFIPLFVFYAGQLYRSKVTKKIFSWPIICS